MFYEEPKAHKMDLKTQSISDNRSCTNSFRLSKCQMLVNTIKRKITLRPDKSPHWGFKI